MMPRKQNNADQEEPVKVWQLEATQLQVNRHEDIIKTFDTKLDTIINQQSQQIQLIQSRPTMEQVDDKIAAASANSREELKNAIEKQDLKYSPIMSNNKTLLGLLLASGIGLFGSLAFIAIGLTK